MIWPGETAGPDPNRFAAELQAEKVPPNLSLNRSAWPVLKAPMSPLSLLLLPRHPPSALPETPRATRSSAQSNITLVSIFDTCTAKSATLTWPKRRYVASRIDQRFLSFIVTHYRRPNNPTIVPSFVHHHLQDYEFSNS